MKVKQRDYRFASLLLVSVLLLSAGCARVRFARDIQSDLHHMKGTSLRISRHVDLDLVFIEGGTFLMGSPMSEIGHESNDSPVRKIQLDGFWIGKYEVTQEQYYAVMGENPSHFKGDALPVENVSWDNAVLFCEKLSQITGVTFTLPTEAQWEYAARAGTTGMFAFGDCLSTNDANYDGTLVLPVCDEGEYRGETWIVGSGSANPWGLYDMHGNVWEWCLDWFSKYNPDDLVNPTGPDDGRSKVFRGGCWSSDVLNCRSAARLSASTTAKGPVVGFRVVVRI
jgi:eukaryotic-like serine/threonine-protein kinase